MSIQSLKDRKVRAIRSSLQCDSNFFFSESLIEAFKADGKPYQVDSLPVKQNDPSRLEPIISFRECISPIMTKPATDVEMSEPSQTTDENAEANLEDMADLLESVHIFTLSSSQIPVRQKSLLLSDLVKLSLPSLKTAIHSIDFKSWPDDVIADLYKEIASTEHMPSATSSLLVQATALTKINELTSSAPRLLMNSILSLAKEDGKPIMNGLIIPLMFYSDLGRPQTEVIVKTISESLNPSQKLLLLQVILSDGELHFSNSENIFSTSTRKYLRPWNDAIFQVINTILSTQPLVTLNKAYLYDLLQPIRTVVQSNPKDKNSMQFLLILTSKYPQALVEFDAIDTVEGICKISTMFLKRSVLGQLSSIKKNMSSIQR